MSAHISRDRTCPVCRRRFMIPCGAEEWGYAYGGRLLCSYRCMRELETKGKRAGGHRPETLAKMERAWKLREAGAKLADIARIVGYSKPDSVIWALNEYKLITGRGEEYNKCVGEAMS